MSAAVDIKHIYHMAHQADWTRAQQQGSYLGSPDDKRDGFMHFSTAHQIQGSAAKHRAGQSDLLLLRVPLAAMEQQGLGQALKWEQAHPQAAFFPHLYAALPCCLVDAVTPLPLGADGLHCFPELAL